MANDIVALLEWAIRRIEDAGPRLGAVMDLRRYDGEIEEQNCKLTDLRALAARWPEYEAAEGLVRAQDAADHAGGYDPNSPAGRERYIEACRG